ncbi:nucleolar protein 14 homolog [Copidosoma floridanum]|uniref:nucleolar protein 14 homolog n=1 Tax=Copidosoma floridanum TaxID=29053 RepID=UPI0006C999CE|nr:nucleolar protein 14 homolog [Copidosoma floridanum]
MAKVKNKRKNLADTYAQRRKERQLVKKTISPFEVHAFKDKKQVLGRKLKNEKGLPGISRAKGIERRKNTLLVEYKVRDKDNLFLDRRIGERNAGMTEEDKAMARFTHERIKAQKKNIYNLNDEEMLTHRGQALIDIEKYDDPKSDEESDEEKSGNLGKKFVEEAHFGGGMLSKPKSEMSRNDIISQLIAESKMRKAERQMTKEKTLQLTEKLDSEWKDLMPLLASSKASKNDVEEEKIDDYDRALREMKFEARGNPTDKLKSEEQIAQEEESKLEKLTAERIARMKGFSDEDDFKKKHRSADDLDDFKIETIEENSDDEEKEDVQGILKNGKLNEDNENSENDDDGDEKGSNTQSDGDAEDGDEEEGDDEEGDDESGGEEEEGSGNESDDNLSDLKASESESDEERDEVKYKENYEKEEKKREKKEAHVPKNEVTEKSSEIVENETNACDDVFPCEEVKTLLKNEYSETSVDIQKRKAKLEKARKELPYTFKAPETYEELLDLLKNRDSTQQSVIVERIIKCNNFKLSNENREKMLKLFKFLLQHLDNCATAKSLPKRLEFFNIFDRLCPQLYDLRDANIEETKTCLRDILKLKHEQFEKRIKYYPGLDTLMLFKLVSILYPTSDFRHPIVTPCLVFMSQILLRCKVRKKSDITKGIFVCTLILEYTVLTKRWSPEVVNFLRGVIYISLPKPFSKHLKVIPPFKQVGDFSNLLVLEESHKKTDFDPENSKMNIKDLMEEEMDDDFRIRTFFTAINLLCEFVAQCSELDAVYTIFEPILDLLTCGSAKYYPKKVRKKIKFLVSEIEKLKEKKLEYLQFNKKKPKALRMIEPQIEKVYDGKKRANLTGQQLERRKLLTKLKNERKSAMREIRRDSAFLAKVKLKEQISADEERKRKVKEIFGEAAMQQHELKMIKKQKLK